MADVNGVCVVPPEFAEQIMANATKKIEGLKKVKEEVLEGKVVPDNYAALTSKTFFDFFRVNHSQNCINMI